MAPRRKRVTGTDGRTLLTYVDGSSNLTGRALAHEKGADDLPASYAGAPGNVIAPGRVVAGAPAPLEGARLEWVLAVARVSQRLLDDVGGACFFRLEAVSAGARKTIRSKALVCDLAVGRFFGESRRCPEMDVGLVRAFRRTHPRAALAGVRAARRSHPGQEKGDSTSLQSGCSRNDSQEESIHALSSSREMIARPKMSQNEWKTIEI